MDKNIGDNKNNESSKTPINNDFFNNQTLSFIHKKTEKISSAIYLVTNHLSENDPLKWSIRELSLTLLKDIFYLRDNFLNNSLILDDIKYQIREIISLLQILVNAGFISKMNHDILESEISNILSFLGPEYALENSGEIDLSAGFFGVGDLKPELSSPNYFNPRDFSKENDSKESLLDSGRIVDKGHSKGQFSKGQFSKGHLSFRELSFNGIKDNTEVSKNKVSGSERKQSILNLIKSKKEVTIKDISKSIKGYSEKTIQRDLVSLVKAGVLKREGDRRWSKYLLA